MIDPLSLALAAREAPDREALRWGDSIWTFSMLEAQVQRAAALLARQGLGPGDRLALKAPNGLPALVTILATLELGATLVPLHPRLTPDEDRVLLHDAAPSLVLGATEAEGLAAWAPPQPPPASLGGESFGASTARSDGSEGGDRSGGSGGSGGSEGSEGSGGSEGCGGSEGRGGRGGREGSGGSGGSEGCGGRGGSEGSDRSEGGEGSGGSEGSEGSGGRGGSERSASGPRSVRSRPEALPSRLCRGGLGGGRGPTGAPAAILYTSGTSGRPKGAVLSRRALAAAAAASAQNLGFLPDERWLLCLPLCHIGGLSIVTRCLLGRGSVVLAPGFEPEAVLGLIGRHRPTLLSVVPTMLHALLERDRDGRLSTLRAVLVGGAAAPGELLDECARRKVLALTTYGMTEACSQVTTQAPRDPAVREPGVGRPLAGVEVQIADERGQPVATGEPGGIRVRGHAMMDGYLGRPPLDGWFDTGDIGSWDEAGRLHLHARRTDLIVTGGENVYPAEVEAALGGLDGVAAALVFGSPDPVWGQIVAAAIVPRGPIDEAALKAQIDARLASHKRPRLVCFVDALPLGSTGKPLRREALSRFGSRLRRWGA